ncbi:RdgB/HAM1 family non-canonical purine NTP pyrophosphatase [Yoonia sp.]|uniref:RdgB/HAM1 family non-canonical purine NTP pyrophosphatase n=1 Tax=Yoonia sp. TaxID=2212373 RepID=UPI00239CAE4D|nr:RdgB/HAM1 family non-canonical purine NTP pyrophosphatase [Yoonia sp.]MDE0851837.1 RdgB/HAM1 family non-canonical purine NTP pyrophosphatase [Yoonia sp.]
MRKFTGDQLVVATHNKGKLEEISALLAPYGVKITSNDDHGLPEPVEDGVTFIDNARIKAHAAAKATGLPALADDSGLSVDALDGAPGIYTADWAETPQGRDFPMAMKKVEDALPADASRKAQFNCTLVLAWPDGHDEVFAGILHGALVWPMRGENGHGYDPVFQPDGFEQTCGEMDRWEKNKISHRADAFNKLVTGCFD